MIRYFIINLLLSILWPAFQGEASLANLFAGFGLGFVVLSIVEPAYGRLVVQVASFTVYVLYAILKSNLRLAWIIVQPRPALDPGIVAVPLDITGELAITVLASIITLTPGTLSVDLGYDERDRQVLFVHSLRVDDPEQFRAEIKQHFERPLLHIGRNLQKGMSAP